MLLATWADSYPGNSDTDDPTSARVKMLETRQLQFYWCGWKFPRRWFLWDRCSNCSLTPNEASSQPSRKGYGSSLKRAILQPPLPFKNNGLSHDQHSVRQQGGSDVCGEIVVTKESSFLHSPYSAFCLTKVVTTSSIKVLQNKVYCKAAQ